MGQKIQQIELFHLKLPLVHHFETSFGRVYHQATLIVKIKAGNYIGYGECPASAQPAYSSETVQTARYIIKEFLAPILLGHQIADIRHRTLNFHHIRGHQMAKAGVLMALADIIAQKKRLSLARLYGGRRTRIPVGISLGIEDSLKDLLKRISAALKQGYQRIKIKIKPGWDIKIVAAIRKRFPKITLWVDANGAYRLEDLPVLKALDKYHLGLIEQPLSYDDLVDHAALQRQVKTPICLDESIKSYHDAEQAIKLKSCRVINIKQARVGGPFKAIRIHHLCRQAGIPVWCGGLLESGIGRAHNIALASLPGFTLPGDISASRRYYKQDIIEPEVTINPDGTINVPTKPGLGFSVNNRLRQYTIHREIIS